MITYLICSTVLSAFINGRSYSLTSDHPHFSILRDALVNFNKDIDDPNYIVGLFDAAQAAEKFTKSEVVADGGQLLYKGQQVHGTVVTRILEFMKQGLPYEPLVEFLKRLQANPSRRSVEELYDFMEANELPITQDGFILAYKGVLWNYFDRYSETIDNHVGAKVPRMPRNQVDDDWRNLCSSGYHVGSRTYAVGFAEKTIIVKIDPADVVSVPDKGYDKMRVCYYEVVSDYAGELPKAVAISSDPYKPEKGVLAFLKRVFRGK